MVTIKVSNEQLAVLREVLRRTESGRVQVLGTIERMKNRKHIYEQAELRRLDGIARLEEISEHQARVIETLTELTGMY